MLDYLLVAVLVYHTDTISQSFQRGIPESRLCENVSEPWDEGNSVFLFLNERYLKLCVSHHGNWLWEPNLLAGRFTWRNPESGGDVWQGLSFPSQQHHVEAERIHIVLQQGDYLDLFRWALIPWAERYHFSSVHHLSEQYSQSGYIEYQATRHRWRALRSAFLSLCRLINHLPAVRKRGIIHISFGFFLFPTDSYKSRLTISLHCLQQRNFKVHVSNLLPHLG